MVKKKKEKESKTKKEHKQTNNYKRQGRKGYTNNPGVSAVTLSGTPWCNGGLSNFYLSTFTLNSLSSL